MLLTNRKGILYFPFFCTSGSKSKLVFNPATDLGGMGAEGKVFINQDHSFSTYAEFPEKLTFSTT